MQSLIKRTQAVFLASIVLMFVFNLFAPNVASAQLVPDALNPNAVPENLPQYNAGVDKSIEEYLCTPKGTGTDLADCIVKLQRFGITAGAVVLVFFVVLAGYMYITSAEGGKKAAKGMILSAITGMAILLGSYALLNFVNPDLLKIKPIQPPIFSALNLPSCEAIGFGQKCITSDGQVFNPGGGTGVPGSQTEAQYKTFIQKYAQANGMDYCALSALMQKESTFNRYARSNPPGSIDPSKEPPTYGQSFSVYHAIGLTQITIYPKSQGGWVGDTPARSSPSDFGKSPLTLEMLLDPETNISAGAHYFGKLVKANKGNLRIAYDDFQSGPGDTGAPGKPDSDPRTLDKYMQMYNACKLRGG